MIDRADMLYSPAYKNLNPCHNTYAVSSPNGAKRHMVSGPLPHRVFVSRTDSPPLPGLSSMLQHQRSPQDAFILSPRSPPRKLPLVRATTPDTSSKDDPEQSQYKSGYCPKIEHKLVRDHYQAPVSTMAPPSSNLTAPVQKSSRYLREMDRRAILSRIEQGEKQSALAKEYKVSRAAICNLNKHRDEVLSRKDGNPLAKHPKKPRLKTMMTKVGKSDWAAVTAVRENSTQEQNPLHEIKSRPAALLLTMLRKKHATVSEFRRSSDRLMRIVMEEALAHVPVKTVEIFLPNHSKSDGVALEHPPCAISMDPSGCPMLDLFHLMEPDQPSGYVTFGNMASPNDSESHNVQAKVCGSRLPGSLNYHNVFILDNVVTSAEAVIAVVRQLQEHGAVEAMISLVTLIATAEAVKKVHAVFPALKIVFAQVDATGDELAALSTGRIDTKTTRMRTSTADMISDRLEQAYHGLPPTNAY